MTAPTRDELQAAIDTIQRHAASTGRAPSTGLYDRLLVSEEEVRELKDIVLNLTGEYPTSTGQFRMAQRIKELEARVKELGNT